jgi:hypothetical protein
VEDDLAEEGEGLTWLDLVGGVDEPRASVNLLIGLKGSSEFRRWRLGEGPGKWTVTTLGPDGVSGFFNATSGDTVTRSSFDMVLSPGSDCSPDSVPLSLLLLFLALAEYFTLTAGFCCSVDVMGSLIIMNVWGQ